MSNRQLLVASLSLLLTVTALPILAQPTLGPELLVATPVVPAEKAASTLDGLFYDYLLFDLEPAKIAQQIERHQALRAHFGNQTLDLALVPNDLRDADYRAVVIQEDGTRVEQKRTPVVTYKGTVRGDQESIVRLTATPDMFMGYVKTAQEWLFIDQLSDYLPGSDSSKLVVYLESDVRPDANKKCGADHYRSHAQNLSLPPLDHGATKMARRVDIATEADGQYFNLYGNPGLFNRISGIINGVDGIYRSQLNLTLNITHQQAWSSVSGDPYTSLNAQTTLFQFRDWWNANNGSINRDVAHQWSGKNFSGSTVGIAWVGVVCNVPSLSYGVSQDQGSSFLRTQLAAHEIGHNFDANHDNQSPVCPGVNCNGSGPIMCSFLQSSGSNSFSSCSRSSIASQVASNGFCLN